MKQILLLITALACLTSCRGNRVKIQELRAEIDAKNAAYAARNDSAERVNDSLDIVVDSMREVRDSLFFAYKSDAERLAVENKSLKRQVGSMKVIVDSMQVTSDTLAARLLHARLMIENARYYLRIANRNQSQQKFLRGWMNRALEMQ